MCNEFWEEWQGNAHRKMRPRKIMKFEINNHKNPMLFLIKLNQVIIKKEILALSTKKLIVLS